MGVYTRFKREADGFRHLVELLETTPVARREKMIDVGMAEDPEYTELALSYMLNFEDLSSLPDPELAELIAVTPPRTVAYSLMNAPADVAERFMRNARADVALEIQDYLATKITLAEVGGARLKLIEFARKLERKGLLSAKKIPA